jgi:hypothetical protein
VGRLAIRRDPTEPSHIQGDLSLCEGASYVLIAVIRNIPVSALLLCIYDRWCGVCVLIFNEGRIPRPSNQHRYDQL